MDRKPNKRRKIPFQARRLVREVLSGKHKTIASAGQAAGYTGPGAYRDLRNLQGTISEIMDQAGISDAYLVQNCLHPLLHATRTKHFNTKGRSETRAKNLHSRSAEMRWTSLSESKGSTRRQQ